MAKQTTKRSTSTPIHKGVRRKWDWLELVDRASGEVERIRLDHPDSAASVTLAANRNGMTTAQAWDVLLGGGTLATASFVRRLACDDGSAAGPETQATPEKPQEQPARRPGRDRRHRSLAVAMARFGTGKPATPASDAGGSASPS